jgi:hypothetical protein
MPQCVLVPKGQKYSRQGWKKKAMSLPEITNLVILLCAVTEAPWLKSFFFQAGESPENHGLFSFTTLVRIDAKSHENSIKCHLVRDVGYRSIHQFFDNEIR